MPAKRKSSEAADAVGHGESAIGSFLALALSSILFLPGCGNGGGNGSPSPALAGEQPAFPFRKHVDQRQITSGKIGFTRLFDLGDKLFEVQYNALDGVGALLLPDGTPLSTRFSRIPPGGGRFTGPNAQACVGCHDSPFSTSAGEGANNVLQDPSGNGSPPFNTRNTLSLFGSAALQRLAEEITEDLLLIRDEARGRAILGGPPVTLDLVSKGVSFGRVAASRDGGGNVAFDLSGVEGVDLDLVVRPYGWKGNVTTLRDFCRGAARNELGMEPDELVAKEISGSPDPDGDGVEGEFSVGDITAITIYVGAQEVPQPLERLVRDGFLPPPTDKSGRLIERGRAIFEQIGCAACHVPELQLMDPVFEEPTLRGGGNYFDPEIDPGATALDPGRPFRFHLAREGDFPRFEPHPERGLRVRLFGDLKRHNMGRALADAQPTPVKGPDGSQLVIDGSPVEVPEALFLTAELWGTGNTGPWLHDGRAGSLVEAISLHGEETPPSPGDPDRSEAQESRDAFGGLSADDHLAVIEFLKSLLLFALPEKEAD